MKDWTLIRERYLRDIVPVRLGGLAANLSRIKSFSAQDTSREAVESIIDESKFFIEWTGAEAEVNTAAELVELQVQLARWQRNWARIWADPVERRKVADHFGFLVEARIRNGRFLVQIIPAAWAPYSSPTRGAWLIDSKRLTGYGCQACGVPPTNTMGED